MIDHYRLENQPQDKISWDQVEHHLEYELRAKRSRIQEQIRKLEREIEDHEIQIAADRERIRDQINYQEELIKQRGADLEPDSEMRNRILELNKKLGDLSETELTRLSDLRREKGTGTRVSENPDRHQLILLS